ncbi:MAG: hypothetical protein GXY42_03020 [Desulfovibrionales bacterium]|nr:hypothetical protein [Desulfovibrionales bacterium]
MVNYTIEHIKGIEEFYGSIGDAVRRAIAIEKEFRPALGVTVSLGRELLCEVIDGVADKTSDAWWIWHDEDPRRWSDTEVEAVQRCESWMAGKSDDGPF